MKKVLIIDDEERLRNLLSQIVSFEGFEVFQAATLKAAEVILAQKEIDLILCDVKLPDGNGVDFTRSVKERFTLIEIILFTAFGQIEDGVRAIKNGAFDYITKGDENNKIIPLLHRAAEKIDLCKRLNKLEEKLKQRYSFQGILGKSKSLATATELAHKVASSDITVLLTGETGTGKEVFAQAIHHESARRQRSFVAINCSALSKDILESEMFGHRAGAFTGATRDQKGFFEEANHGTIFLDEIGEMPLELQAKLLRVLETGEFIRIGDTRPTQVNVRVIAATNRDMKEEVRKGNFREDLYYRISVFEINIPPLRERGSDIDVLALHFLEIFSAKTNKRIQQISPDALSVMRLHPWPGNVRELKNVMERAVILCSESEIGPEHLPAEIQNTAYSTRKDTISGFELAAAEKVHIQKVLNYCNGNKTKTAELLRIALTTLYRKLSEYGLD